MTELRNEAVVFAQRVLAMGSVFPVAEALQLELMDPRDRAQHWLEEFQGSTAQATLDLLHMTRRAEAAEATLADAHATFAKTYRRAEAAERKLTNLVTRLRACIVDECAELTPEATP